MATVSSRPTRMHPVRRVTAKNNRSSKNRGNVPLSVIVFSVMSILVVMYVAAVVVLAKYTNDNNNAIPTTPTDDDEPIPKLRSKTNNFKENKPLGRKYSREEWGDKTVQYAPKRKWGQGVEPQVIVEPNEATESQEGNKASKNEPSRHQQSQRIMTAYVEPVDQSLWTTKPLPVRTTTKKDLTSVPFQEVNSCSRLTEQIPADKFPDDDPFLPWIHDVFPTHDGKFIQIVAQNKRRCKTGTNQQEKEIASHMAPQIALFQHVAVKRVAESQDERRYKLSSHEDADEDGISTRFICRFSNGEETLSVFNFSYEWASYRKKMRQMFHEDGRDNSALDNVVAKLYGYIQKIPPSVWNSIPLTIMSTVLSMMIIPWSLIMIDDWFQSLAEKKKKDTKKEV